MNKHLHRIIFNQARGVLMAVAECASSHSRGDAEPDASQPQEAALAQPSFNVHPIACAILVLIGCTIGFAPYAKAQIVGDQNAPKKQQATILNAGNGVPLVNIQTPSGAGVSRNIYSQFDVQANGAILNNSRSNAQTQLSGWVQGNPWLATGSARVILNEVNSANPSQLRGYVEVAGSRAQVVIANPAGVTCDGCGFINANRATLTTGTPIMNGGSLDGFRVERGQILIQGSGLDARQVDYTDLIAQAITVNAGIWANTLKLVTGTNQVDAEAGTVSPIVGSGPAPSFALDVGQLGGMYAGKIVMIGSEAGVGVRNAGQIGAAIGEISLTAEGRLINTGTLSTTAQTLSIVTRGLDNSGTLSSQADIAITSQGDITNSGLINAGRENKLEIAGSIDNSGALSGQRLDFSAGNLVNTGTIRQTGSQALVLSIGDIVNQLGATFGHLTPSISTSNQGASSNVTVSVTTDAPSTAAGGGSVTSLAVQPEILADGRIALRGDLTNSDQLTANGRFETSATGLNNRGTVNLDALTINGDRLLNAGGTLIVTDLTTRTTTFDNTAGQIKVARNLSINANDLINAQGSILHAGTSDLDIQVGAGLNNTDGTLTSNTNRLNLSAGALDNTRGKIVTQGALSVQTTQGALINDAGLLSAERGLVATASGTISNQAGQILNAGTEALTLTAANVSNTNGKIQSNGALQITAPVLTNQGGTISAQGTVNLTATTSLDNSTNGLITSGDNLTVTAGSLNNTQGKIVSKGALSVQTTQGALINDAGLLSAERGLVATASGTISNQAGQILNAGTEALTLTAASLSNTNGKIQSNGALQITAPVLTNQGGTISAQGTVNLTATTSLDNSTNGLITSGDNLTVTAGSINNSQGQIASTGGNLVMTSTGQTINTGGALQAVGSVKLANTGFNNAGGKVSGTTLELDTHSQSATNAGGLMIASQNLTLNTGALINDAGLIQSGAAMSINTQGQTLSNRNAGQLGIISKGTLTINSGNIDNTSGYLGALGAIDVTASALTNTSGVILGSNSTRLNLASLDNAGGQIQSTGTLTVNATGALVNTEGLLRSSATLSAQANRIDNNQTTSDNQGIEGYDITLSTPSLNNNNGAIRADHNLSFTGSGSLDNASGLLSAGNLLSIQDALTLPTLAITNTDGRQIAGQKLDLKAASVTGDGQLLSEGDLSLVLTDSFTNSNQVQAANNLNLSTQGAFSNSGTLQAGNNLDLSAVAIDNQAYGEISALNTTHLTTPGTLTNRGLIDGYNTRLDASTVNNLGGGRIYGDHLSIAATHLNTFFEDDRWPILAARTRLDLAVTGTLNNDPGTLIFSGGHLAIGGALDANRQATGRGGVINNAGGTIQSLGEMNITAQQINNTNPNFSATATFGPTVNKITYNTSQGTLTSDQVTWVADNQGWDGTSILAGNGSPNFLAFTTLAFVRDGVTTTNVTVYSIINESYQPLVAHVWSSTPGQILAGGNMTLDASQALINDKSQIIAGGALNVFGQSIANIAAEVSGTESHTGISSAWGYAGHDGKSTGHHCDCDFYAYKPAFYALDVLVTLASPISVVQQYQAPGGGSTIPGQGSVGSVGTTSASGTVANVSGGNTAPGALPGTTPATGSSIPGAQATGSSVPGIQATGGKLPQATGTSPVALSVPANLSVPATSLYHLHPGLSRDYLIETDPRFANYRSWLSSDYLLTALAYAPTSVQKRLGDGFYEQQLIREQIALLTGQRFLQGFDSDEAQYRALMNQSATVAQAWQLRPGVALTASQIAQLTSDIVWLVEQTVTLPDGTTQQVLVPQVYVIPRSGDLRGDGTLLAGNTIHLAASGDFSNSGTVAGRNLVDLRAENIKNLGGQIAGDQVSLKATHDIDNIGGRIAANSSLALMAGRDINVSSTTVSGSGQSTLGQTTGQFTATRLDRLAGLYVTGDQGLLLAVAGRDINLTAAEVSNTHGDSQLLAGHDLNLDTLTLNQQSDIRYSPGNTAKFGNRTEIGSTIKSGGSLALAAGNDINARATRIDAEGDLSLKAGNDITLSAGYTTQFIDQTSQRTSKTSGLFGKTTQKTTAFQEERSDAVGSSLSGQNISLQAGRDLSLEAATLAAQDKLALAAGRDLTVSTAESYVVRNEQQKVSTKENYGPGKQSLKTTRDEITVTPAVSQLSAQDITLQSGRDLTLVAPRITADTLTAFAGNQLTIAAATATHELKESSEFKTNRFNFSEVTAPLRGSNGVRNAIGLPTDKTFVTGGRIKDKIRLTESEGERQAVVAEIDAKTITLNSVGDTLLVAPKIRAETLSIEAGSINGEVINPEARIQFIGVKESTTGSSSKNSHSFVHETVRDGGESSETLKLPDIELSGKGTIPALALVAPGGIVVGATSLIPTQRELQTANSTSGSQSNTAKPPPGQIYDLKSQAQTLAKQPGLAWLGEVAQRKDVDWQQIELAQQNWDYKRAGLTQEGAAVVVIVVTVLTAGWGSGLGGAVGGGVEAATGSAVAGTVASAATAAAVTTLASQATVSLINNQGDVGKTLQDLGSQENIKALVTSMLTAGLTQGVTTAFNLPNPANASFANRFATYTTRAMISAGVQSVVYGTPLSETAKTALITSLAQTLTSEIGDWGKSDSALIAKTIAHAVVQCAAASVQGKDCGSAALGAAVAEAISPLLDKMDASTKPAGYEQSLGSSIAGMGAMLAAGLTGKDALTALNSAQMVEYFNRQLHVDQREMLRKQARSTEQYQRELAVLCVVQNCMVDGLFGKTIDAESQALMAQGLALQKSDPQLFAKTMQDVLASGALSGLNSYMQMGFDFSKDAVGLGVQAFGSGKAIPNDSYSVAVPLVDGNGRAIVGGNGKPVLIPKGVDLATFAQAGRDAAAEAGTPSLAFTASDLAQFDRGGRWDLQRLQGAFDSRYIDVATIAIGVYAASAGISIDRILEIQNFVAQTSVYAPGTLMNSQYPNLPMRNVVNTEVGYGLIKKGQF